MRRSTLSLLLLGTLLAIAARSAHAAAAFDRADLDTTCAPCRDFYQFATGGWREHNTIPASEASWGSFDVLYLHNQEGLRTLLEGFAAQHAAPAGSSAQRLGDFYATCMDSAAAEAAGATPLQPMLLGVDGMTAAPDIAGETGWLHAHGVRSTFNFGAGPDARHSDLTIAIASQGGLSMPDRDYYLSSDSEQVAVRIQYVAHVARMLRLIGRQHADEEANAILQLETALAGASMTNVQRRDPQATYHKVPLDTLRAWMPGFAWDRYFQARAMRAPDSINVTQPEFFRALARLASTTSLDTWRTYLRWRVVSANAPMLSDAFVQEDFAFARVLSGAKEILPRWKRCVLATDGDLGDLLGAEYVREHFPPAAHERALELIHNLEAALGERIAALDWMTPATKAAAKHKLDAFANKIGYPDHPRDYAGVVVNRQSWLANHVAASEWETARNVAKVGKPVDKGEWTMTAPTVNAYYSGAFNSINFPAGILQPPFYDHTWDDGLIYGGIGAVIGHEMTHGFDDRGRQFDAQGNMRDWWTAADAERYKARAALVADQFDHYTVAGTVHVNGKLTLGEDIADLGGIAVAYAALEKALAGKPRTMIDGFTPEQRFFLSWARVWQNLDRPEAIVTQVKTDPHAPAQYRVNGPFSNLDEFAKAFGCKPGDAMVRKQEERARIW